MTKEEFWQECLLHIKNGVSEQAFQTWFDDVDIISFGEEDINLQVPNQFHFEWLESKYRHLIDDAIKKVDNTPRIVNYSITLTKKNSNDLPSFDNSIAILPSSNKLNTNLNYRYNFETFIEGKGNQFAKVAALSIADRPGQTPFNPLLIYSSPGLGKTHLLQAIGNQIYKGNPSAKLICITAERFMFDFINSIQKNQTTAFSKKYRNIDMLLLDDAQFFEKKEQTQEQFFHLFNHLYQNGKQIVLTSDKHPNQMSGFKERLISRFQSGLIVDIQPPDLETRIAILMNKSENDALDIPYEVLEFMASNITGDIRTLEGALVNLLALSSLKKQDINLTLAKHVLINHIGKKRVVRITIEQIIDNTAKVMKINKTKILGKGRQMDIALSRQVAMYLSRKLTGLSLSEIGEQMGGRDHSTVIHAYKKIEKKLVNNVELKQIINQIESYIK